MKQPSIISFRCAPTDDERLVRELVGGKGKSLIDLTALGLAVPPGFVIPTPFCRAYLESGWSDSLEEALSRALAELESVTGKRLGDPNAPLLVSVRSGSAVSMPGMMDTVLNVGLDDAVEAGLAWQTDSPAFAADCRHRLAQTFWKSVGAAVPKAPGAQLRAAIQAVFCSWNSDRAKAYRRIERLNDDAGTAVTVQMMVFGNLDDRSGTGVVFSRDPSTGAPGLYGDVLFRAQGEDVVAGNHKTLSIAELIPKMPALGRQLAEDMRAIERHYRDVVEVEFTIEAGKLWILQARVGKRSPRATLRIAHDLAEDPTFPLTRAEAVQRVGDLLSTASFRSRRSADSVAFAKGLAASPGVASGLLAVSCDQAIAWAAEGKNVILARPETSPSDIEGISAASGLLTAKGGFASHAAVVARGWGKPAVVGLAAMDVGDAGITIDGRHLATGTVLSLDGETGEVFDSIIEIEDSTPPEAAILRSWREAGADAPQAHAAEEISDDELVLLLAIKGMATLASIASIAGLDPVTLDARLQAMGPFAERPNATFVKASAAAHERAADLIASHAEVLGRDAKTLEAFKPYNTAFKTLVTAWQMRPAGSGTVANDHTDASYDASVLAGIRTQHAAFAAWLGAVAPPRALAFYARRLDRALAKVDAGETAFLVSPRVDSYHNVWFELHEYLIRLSGRTRSQEDELH